MGPRKRSPQQLTAQPEAVTEGTGVFEEESTPMAVRPPEDLVEVQANLVGTALIEEVIGVLGRVELFDADSLEALRLTCKAFRDAVDATGATSAAKFKVIVQCGRPDLLETWAAGTRLTSRTRSLSIYGYVPKELAKKVLAALIDHRPPISKLNLDNVDVAAEPLLTAPLDALRELRLGSIFNKRRSFIQLAYNTSIHGLQSLSLESAYPVDIDASDVATVLAHFGELRSLKLKYIQMNGNYADLTILKNALNRLETLEVDHCRDVEKVGILGGSGPALPALRTFHLSHHHMSTAPLWLSHLTELSFDCVRLTSPRVAEALSGVSLECLRLLLASGIDQHVHWNCSNLELAHLTRLELRNYSGDAMGDVAKARLPSLRHAELQFDEQTSSLSVKEFASAFPELCGLKLYGGHWINARGNGPAVSATLEAFREIIPRLEYLSWSTTAGDPLALLNGILPAGPADGDPCWPRLKSLELLLGSLTASMDTETEVLVTIARAAPHFPALTSLRLGYMSSGMVSAFLATAKEVQAWPLLRTLQLNVTPLWKALFLAEVQQVWPRVTLV